MGFRQSQALQGEPPIGKINSRNEGNRLGQYVLLIAAHHRRIPIVLRGHGQGKDLRKRLHQGTPGGICKEAADPIGHFGYHIDGDQRAGIFWGPGAGDDPRLDQLGDRPCFHYSHDGILLQVHGPGSGQGGRPTAEAAKAKGQPMPAKDPLRAAFVFDEEEEEADNLTGNGKE